VQRLSIYAIALVLTAASAAPAPAQTNVKLMLDWAFQGIHGLFTMAEDGGHFAREGLTVKIDRGYGSGDTIAKVASGTYEFGLADVNSLVTFNAKNPNTKVIAFFIPFDTTETSIVALKKSNIKTPKDLEGRTIAAPAGTSARLLFPIFANANGINAASVKWLTAKPDIKDSLLLRGEADAVTAFPSTTLMFLETQGVAHSDAVVLRYAEHGLDLFGNGLVASEQFASKNPDVLKAFSRAVAKGMRDALADPKKAVASARKRDDLLREDVELKRFAMITQSSVLTPNVKANGFSHVDEKRLARTIEFVAKAMNIETPPKPGDVFRSDYLPAAAERKP
jgi:NitT/TauT family transport system substrate-binding protein